MITLINPNLIVSKNDVFTTGIVYMPISLAYFAATLKESSYPLTVIDAFGERPNQIVQKGNFLVRGLTPEEIGKRIPPSTQIIFLYAINISAHDGLCEILKTIRAKNPSIPIVILENSQAVTSYSLRNIQNEFYDLGADYVITGDLEKNGILLIESILGRREKTPMNGIGFREQGKTNYLPPQASTDLDQLPFPAWELFPLENYWKLKYAHGPFETKKYLPLLTSRGCPYPCTFCVIPEMSGQRWRPRSPRNVVDEIEYYLHKFGVREFHIEDVDPTVDDSRTKAICQEIINRKLNIIWKICAGTKVETIRNEETVTLMAKSGCRYISISPETGSPKVLKLIKKPFRIHHAIQMAKKMAEEKIFTQACFVLGHPGEEDDDRQLTKKMIHDLTKVGIDEIALFIITPIPGSKIYPLFSGQFQNYSQLNFSPEWRADYRQLNQFRLHLYKSFLFWKMLYWPWKFFKQPFYFLNRKFKTKMEMAPYRAGHTLLIGPRTMTDRSKKVRLKEME